MTTPRPKPRTRRFLQFTLRGLLIFVLLVSVGMSWFAVKLEKARRQKEAVEAIEGLGGFVYHEWPPEAWAGSRSPPEPPEPQWILDLLGEDFFWSVRQVSWYGSSAEVTDERLVYLKEFQNLKDVSLRDTQITDSGLARLRHLKKLERLWLTGTAVTDAGLVHFQGLLNLKQLSLADTVVTDHGLVHLRGLTKLRTLNLELTSVTPEGVKKLQEALPECEIVY